MDQLNIYDLLFPKYKITKPIRLIECFAGIGSQAKSLKKLQKEFGFQFEHYRVIEFDKYAIASYNAVHGTDFETTDITKIHASDLNITETNKYDYIMTYSFPCQDLSLAGKKKGMTKGSGTRSGLLWEVERLLDECNELPQILLMENVPQIISSRNMNDFHSWQKKLEDLGYTNYVSLLNSKDYGIPQNRNRCFMVSILGQYSYSFPKGFELKLRLKDMLEDKIDEKYYISDKLLKYFTDMSNRNGFVRGERFHPHEKESYAFTITACPGTRVTDNFIKENDRTRKLTPLECWRLMGFDDEDFNKAEKVNSNTQLYKQAGNSIVVDVLYYIFREFFI